MKTIFGVICVELILLTDLATAAVVRQPYLQSVTPTSITVVWRTDLNSADNSRVQYGTVAGVLTQTATGSAIARPGNVKDHIVTVPGLSPATKYFYNVGTVTDGIQGGGTMAHFFVTAPVSGSTTPVRAWIIGDSGAGSINQASVRDAMLIETSNNPPAPHIILHAGDIAYESGTDAEFTSNHFVMYQNILRNTPLWPTLGNHEALSVNTAMGTGPYYDAHVLPKNGEAGGVASGTEAYYSFDYANVHFIVLDSQDSSRTPGSPMLTWLQNDLAATGQTWVIALLHHPPYSKGTHNSDSAADSGGRMVDMRENVLPILEAGGVDLVIAGHSHTYERSYLIDGAYGYGSAPNFVTPSFSTLQTNGNILDAGDGDPSGQGAYQKNSGGISNGGAVYMVAGHGGKSVGGSGLHPVMVVFDISFGSVLLDINGSTLTGRNLRSSGTVTDTFMIQKASDGGSPDPKDFDANGKADILWRNINSTVVAIWLMNGASVASSGFVAGVPSEWTIVGTGDTDGNGTGDIVWRNNNNGAVAVWLMNGITITSVGFPGGAASDWQIKGIGDVDGNGRADLIWRNSGTGQVAIWLLNGGTLASSGFVGILSPDWTIAGTGDTDGNGTADIVWRNSITGGVAVWLMNGMTVTGVGFPGSATSDWQIKGMGDVDGNGRADLIWRNGISGQVAAWLLNGGTLVSSGFPASAPLEWEIRQVSDTNGDGRADLVWHHIANGSVAIWFMNGLNIDSAGFPGGTTTDWQIQK